MLITAIDPGAKETGIAVVEFTEPGYTPRLVRSVTINRGGLDKPILPYLERVHQAVELDTPDLLAIETVVAPTLPMGRAAFRPGPLLDTAIVAGFCVSFHHTVVMVPPEGNGAGPLASYPEVLVSARERAHPNWRGRLGSDCHGRLRHERSAYDVARRGHQLRRTAHTRTPAATPAQDRLERLAQ